MNIEWLKSFVEAAKQKSLSKAAKLQNLSQPALSKQIRNLEQDLDIVLFHRTSTGIELTEAGERLYNRILSIIYEISEIRQELLQFRTTTPIAIGSLPSIATYYLPQRMQSIQRLNRPISLMIQNTSGELLQSLQEGRLDVVFVDTSYVMESLWSYELFSESYYAVFPLYHRLRSREFVELADLCEEPLIVHQSPCDTRKYIAEKIVQFGHKPNIVQEVPFGDFIYGSVMAGMGITILPELMAKQINHLQLFTLPIQNFGKRSVSIVCKSAKLGANFNQSLSICNI